jgi:actin-related protein
MIPGFIERLEEEIIELLDLEEFSKLKSLKKYVKIQDSVFPRNLLNWIGGSIISVLQGIEKYAVYADNYKENGLRDLFGTYYLLGNRPPMTEIYKVPSEKKRLSVLNP